MPVISLVLESSAAPSPALLPQPETTILVLGSKPRPTLPPATTYGALACANASGFSARAHGLPAPLYTVISALLGSGNASTDTRSPHCMGWRRAASTSCPVPCPKTPCDVCASVCATGGHDPLIDQRGSALSKHADTDIDLLAAIQTPAGG